MPRSIASLVLLMTFPLAAAAQNDRAGPQPVRGKFLPPKGNVLLFIQGEEDSPEVESWRTAVRTEPSGYAASIDNWEQDPWSLRGFLWAGRDSDHAALLRIRIGGDQLDTFLHGGYDDRLHLIARILIRCRRPVFIVLSAERAEGRPHAPRSYAEAFRRLRQVWTSLGVDNVAYVFDADGGLDERSPGWDAYPGDDQADWVGVSVFRADDLAAARRTASAAKRRGKPVMISDCGPLNYKEWQDDWSAWFDPFFRFVRESDVRAIVYRPGHPDEGPATRGGYRGGSLHRLSPDIRADLVTELQKTAYLRGDDELFGRLGFEPRWRRFR